MGGPLAGLRVLEFAGIGPGPHAVMLMADMGAEVVRVLREGQTPNDPVMGRGRHDIELDTKSDAGREAALEAIAGADVLVEGFRPGVMERLGLGPDEALARNPGLIYGRMTGWGQDGPLAKAAGHDINYIALTGALAAIGPKGEANAPPLNLVGDFGGGSLYLVVGILAALHERERSGKGQVVDAAIVDGTASLMSIFAGGRISLKPGERLLGGDAHFYRCYECADGKQVAVGAIEGKFYEELCERVGLSSDLKRGDRDNWPELSEQLAAIFRTKSRNEWTRLLEGTDACFAPVLTMDESPDHPHMAARRIWRDQAGVTQPGPAPRFSRTESEIKSTAYDGADVLARWAKEER